MVRFNCLRTISVMWCTQPLTMLMLNSCQWCTNRSRSIKYSLLMLNSCQWCTNRSRSIKYSFYNQCRCAPYY